MILTGKAIEEAVRRGEIEIDPFDASNLNPNSYDLHLGTGVCVYEKLVWMNPNTSRTDGSQIRAISEEVSVKDDLKTLYFEMDPDKGWLLKPGIGYLMHTAERIHTDTLVSIIDGKSSIGRLFVSVHQTAGYGDTGFNGQYTLEMTTIHPIRIFPGMKIAQVRFHMVAGDITLYSGKYQKETAKGAVGSNTNGLV